MKTMLTKDLTNRQFVNMGFVTYADDFKKEVVINKCYQGFAAYNVVDGEEGNIAWVYETLCQIYLDYRDLGYQLNY